MMNIGTTIKKRALKAISVISVSALIFSAPAQPLYARADEITVIEASDSEVSSLLFKNDTFGTDITDSPNIYLDNSDMADGKTSQTVTVTLADANGNAIQGGDAILFDAGESGDSVIVKDITKDGVTSSVTLELSAVEEKDGVKTPLSPGTVSISFTNIKHTIKGELKVTVYSPATDMVIYWNGSDKPLPLNDFSPKNFAEIGAVEKHSYLLSAGVLPRDSTDKVKWGVYEGLYTGETGTYPTETDKATITSDGVFTALKPGDVTIVAKFEATPSSPRLFCYGEKKIDENGKETTSNVKTVPKYIHVTIVKENPASSIVFTKAPEALEPDETYQIQYEVTSGSSQATDQLKWSSSDPSVIVVYPDGLVKALKKGVATVTLQAENQKVFAEQRIRVINKATDISISPSPASTRVSVPIELTAAQSPQEADDEIVWTSSDESIATVEASSSGTFGNKQTAHVTGVAEGTVKITATAKNSGVSKDIEVKVEPRVESDSLTITYNLNELEAQVFDNTTIDIFTNQDIVFSPKLSSLDGSTPDDSVEWEIEGNNDATVTILSQTSSALKLHGSSEGTITVKAKSKAADSISKEFYVRVLKACDTIKLNETDATPFPVLKSINVGALTTIVPDLRIDGNYPYRHSDSVIDWTSDNPEIAQVDDHGSVRALSNGKAKITATTASGKTAFVTIYVFTTSQVIMGNVSPSADGALPTAAVILNNQGQGTIALSAQVKDQNGEFAENADCVWSCSDESIASVDNHGKVTAVKLGKATITVQSGSKIDQCSITVFSSIKNAEIENVGSQVFSPIRTTYEPKPIIRYNGYSLIEGLDFSISYENNAGVGSASMIVTGMRYFTGTRTIPFAIQPKPITDSEVFMGALSDMKCTGSALTPVPEMNCSGVILEEDVDFSVTYSANTYPGTASAIIKGKGNYSDSVTLNFNITCDHEGTTEPVITRQPTCSEVGLQTIKCKICGQTIESEIPTLPHTFTETVVAPTANNEGYTLHTCTVCGYSYKDNEHDKIPGISITECTAILSANTFAYTGKPITPGVTLRRGTVTLTEGTDYAIGYVNNTDIGTGYVIISGMGTYMGTGKASFTIAETVSDTDTAGTAQVIVGDDTDNEDDDRISLEQDEVIALNARIYNPTEVPFEPKPVVSAGGVALIENVDFVMTYANNDAVGLATATMVGIGRFKNAARFQFEILPMPLTDSSITVRSIEKQRCTGKAVTPVPVVLCDGVILANRKDYKLTYSSNVNPGIATMVITGIGNYEGALSVPFQIECDHQYSEQVVAPTYTAQGYTLHTCSICGATYKDNYTQQLKTSDISNCTARLEFTSATYTGDIIKPTVTVVNNNKLLIEGTDYTLEYANNREVGLASVTVKGKGAYTGYVLLNFTISNNVKGDVNGDGAITAEDALMVLRSTVGALTLDSYQKSAADVNGDGNIASDDALALLRYSVGLPVEGLGNSGTK